MKNEEQGHDSMEGEGERRRWISNGWRKHPILLLTRSRGLSIDSGYTIILYTAVSKQRTIPQMKRRKLLAYIFKKKDRTYYKSILFVQSKSSAFFYLIFFIYSIFCCMLQSFQTGTAERRTEARSPRPRKIIVVVVSPSFLPLS